MIRVVAVRLIVLAYALLCVAGQQSPCHDDAPDSCEFTGNRSCGWILGGAVEFRMDGNDSSVAFGGQGKAAGNLTSRVACPTGGREHCLEFRYLFERNNILEINVYIQEIGGESHLVWYETGSDSVSWEQANVSVKPTYNFTIVFEMKKLSLTAIGQSVLINSINYTQSPCSPSSTTAEPSPSTASTDTSPTDNPSSTGVIVGIVVGVVIAVAVAVAILIFILYRRKQFQFRKFPSTSHYRRENDSDAASHTDANNSHINHSCHVNRASSSSEYENHWLDIPTAQSQNVTLSAAKNSTDVEDCARNASIPEYFAMNKTKKAGTGELRERSEHSIEKHCQIGGASKTQIGAGTLRPEEIKRFDENDSSENYYNVCELPSLASASPSLHAECTGTGDYTDLDFSNSEQEHREYTSLHEEQATSGNNVTREQEQQRCGQKGTTEYSSLDFTNAEQERSIYTHLQE